MAIQTVMGTEIEFGIMVKNDPDFDPISSCVLIVNAYREDPNGKILWDYDQENPLADARGFQVEGEKYTPNQQENMQLRRHYLFRLPGYAWRNVCYAPGWWRLPERVGCLLTRGLRRNARRKLRR